MAFKVIITRPSVEDDEHTYYGIAFLKPGKVKSDQLKFNSTQNRLETTHTFDDSPIAVNDKFLAMLIPVNESETIEPPLHQFGVNHPENMPEVVNF